MSLVLLCEVTYILRIYSYYTQAIMGTYTFSLFNPHSYYHFSLECGINVGHSLISHKLITITGCGTLGQDLV